MLGLIFNQNKFMTKCDMWMSFNYDPSELCIDLELFWLNVSTGYFLKKNQFVEKKLSFFKDSAWLLKRTLKIVMHL